MHYQLEHVAIHCRDLNESIKFYEKFFGGSRDGDKEGNSGLWLLLYENRRCAVYSTNGILRAGWSPPLWIRHRRRRTVSPGTSKKKVPRSFEKIVTRRANSQPFSSKIQMAWNWKFDPLVRWDSSLISSGQVTAACRIGL